jgi:hypothetical protein
MSAEPDKKEHRQAAPRRATAASALGLLISPRYLAQHVGIFILLYVGFRALIRFTPVPTGLMYVMPVAYFLYLGLWLVIMPGRKT